MLIVDERGEYDFVRDLNISDFVNALLGGFVNLAQEGEQPLRKHEPTVTLSVCVPANRRGANAHICRAVYPFPPPVSA
jgi:hypothetical protein